MDNLLESLLNDIDLGSTKIILNEVGAGTTVYNLLASKPGLSSKHVVFVESNNDIEFTRLYNNIDESIRLVSKECSEILIMKSIERTQKFVKNHGNDVCGLSNTVQLGSKDLNDNDISVSHGYFTFIKEHVTQSFHYTLPKNWSRKDQIKMIGIIGLEIINYCLNSVIPKNGFIDYCDDLNTLLLFNMTSDRYNINIGHDNAFVINNGEIERFNTIFRNDNKDIIIFKGSFDPVTSAHLNTLNYVTKKYNIDNKNIYFSISLQHRNSKTITNESIINRINLLNKLGFKVIIDTKPYFNDIYNICINNIDYKNQKIHFPLGYDVLIKLLDDCEKESNYNLKSHFINNFSNAIFHAFDRIEKCNIHDDISNIILENDFNEMFVSSTKIRESIKNNNLHELETYYDNIYNKDLKKIIIEHIKNI